MCVVHPYAAVRRFPPLSPPDLRGARPRTTAWGRRAPLRRAVRLLRSAHAPRRWTSPYDIRTTTETGEASWLAGSPGVEHRRRREPSAGDWRWWTRRGVISTATTGPRTPCRGARKRNAKRRHAADARDVVPTAGDRSGPGTTRPGPVDLFLPGAMPEEGVPRAIHPSPGRAGRLNPCRSPEPLTDNRAAMPALVTTCPGVTDATGWKSSQQRHKGCARPSGGAVSVTAARARVRRAHRRTSTRT